MVRKPESLNPLQAGMRRAPPRSWECGTQGRPPGSGMPVIRGGTDGDRRCGAHGRARAKGALRLRYCRVEVRKEEARSRREGCRGRDWAQDGKRSPGSLQRDGERPREGAGRRLRVKRDRPVWDIFRRSRTAAPEREGKRARSDDVRWRASRCLPPGDPERTRRALRRASRGRPRLRGGDTPGPASPERRTVRARAPRARLRASGPPALRQSADSPACRDRISSPSRQVSVRPGCISRPNRPLSVPRCRSFPLQAVSP